MVLLAVVLLSSCTTSAATGPGSEAPSTVDGDWDQLPKSPLSARYSAHVVAIEGRLFVIGGTAADPCPPGADCVGPSERPLGVEPFQ